MVQMWGSDDALTTLKGKRLKVDSLIANTASVGGPTASSQQWFNDCLGDSLGDERFETGTIDIDDLTFSVKK